MSAILAVTIGLMCFPIAMYGYHRTKYIFNPITSMFVMWGLILPVSCWGLYDTVIPSDKVYCVIAVGLLGYLIGVIGGMKPVKYSFGNYSTSNYKEYKINYCLFYILGGIAIIYYASQLVIVIGLLHAGYDYTYIRNLSTATDFNELRSSALVTMTKAFIAAPMTYLTLAMLPFEVFKRKKNWIAIIMAILLMLFYLLSTGGRSVLLWCMLYFAAIFLAQKKNIDSTLLKQFLRKYRLIIILGGIALLVILLRMTFAIKGDDVDLLQQLYIYFVCPLQNFDYHMGVVDASNKYGCGLSSFYGLVYPILFVLSKIGINVFTPFVESIYSMSFQDLQMGIDIGGGIYMNAFVTAFYQPYLDGRYIGVILIMIVFGFMSGRSFYNFYYKFEKKALLIYLLLLQKIIFSYVRFYFTQQAQSICFILAFFMILAWKQGENEDKKITFIE